MGRIGLAFKCFFRILGGKPLPQELLSSPDTALPALPEAAPEPAVKPQSVPEEQVARPALEILGLLQKEARLLDFLQEDIEAYDDGQVGAAVRAIHRDCQRVLQEHIPLAPVVEANEDSAYEVSAGFDPAEVQLVGNITGNPPFSGVLRHHGWRATSVSIPHQVGGDPMIIAPAEVEVN